MDNFSDMLTLEGAGCQRNDTTLENFGGITVQTSYVEGRWHQN